MNWQLALAGCWAGVCESSETTAIQWCFITQLQNINADRDNMDIGNRLVKHRISELEPTDWNEWEYGWPDGLGVNERYVTAN